MPVTESGYQSSQETSYIPSFESTLHEDSHVITTNPENKGFSVKNRDNDIAGIDVYGAGNTYNSGWRKVDNGYNDSNPLLPKTKGGSGGGYSGSMVDNLDSVLSDLDSKTFLKGGIDTKMSDIVRSLNTTLRIENTGISTTDLFANLCYNYDRFKLPKPSLAIKGFYAHVFFVKPKCNILDSNGKLNNQFENDPTFQYAMQHDKNLLLQLSEKHGSGDKIGTNTDFMLSLSNYVKGFNTNDEEVESEVYGETFTGHKIAYGKHDIRSKSARAINVTFMDDNDLHIYNLHKLWVDYIAKVYRGTRSPTISNIYNKILDYAGAIYYILTKEDNETIVFWSKYYGVFPTSIPSSQFSWSYGSLVRPEELTVEYMASFKQDYDPSIIGEFNYNTRSNNVYSGSVSAIDTYDPTLGHADLQYVGKPFIIMVKRPDGKWEYRLKFSKASKVANVVE